ncbi:MAG: hypothetical protein PHH13_05790, partial [Candidatus Peribacteraceae bacterium]|nr:hypothetical protein [Candidatus Peribacteraceae bacterium]
MLPDMPEQKQRLMKFVNKYLQFAEHTANPLLGRLSTFIQHEGGGASYQRVDGKVMEMDYKEISDTLVINRSEIPTLSLEVLCGKINEIAQRVAKVKFQFFIGKIDEVVEETGNSLNMGGKPFAPEHYFQMLEG